MGINCRANNCFCYDKEERRTTTDQDHILYILTFHAGGAAIDDKTLYGEGREDERPTQNKKLSLKLQQ